MYLVLGKPTPRLLTFDEARRIAVDVAKLPGLLPQRWSQGGRLIFRPLFEIDFEVVMPKDVACFTR